MVRVIINHRERNIMEKGIESKVFIQKKEKRQARKFSHSNLASYLKTFKAPIQFLFVRIYHINFDAELGSYSINNAVVSLTLQGDTPRKTFLFYPTHTVTQNPITFNTGKTYPSIKFPIP